MQLNMVELKESELIRIWKNKETGELTNAKINENYEPTKYVYDSNTRIIYYKFEENGVGYMNTYIASDGNPGKIFFQEELPF